MLQDFIRQLSEDFKTDNFYSTATDGTISLFFEEDIEVKISQVDKYYLFKGVIAPFPDKNESLINQIMEANLFAIGTKNAVIGLSEKDKVLMLTNEFSMGVNYKEFKEKIEDFVSILDFWRVQTLSIQ